MAMSEERRNEIAWLLLVQRLKKSGLRHLKPNEFKRDVANGAKEIGISTEEAMEFAKMSIMPLVEEMLKPSRVKVIHDDGHNFRDGVESGPRD